MRAEKSNGADGFAERERVFPVLEKNDAVRVNRVKDIFGLRCADRGEIVGIRVRICLMYSEL